MMAGRVDLICKRIKQKRFYKVVTCPCKKNKIKKNKKMKVSICPGGVSDLIQWLCSWVNQIFLTREITEESMHIEKLNLFNYYHERRQEDYFSKCTQEATIIMWWLKLDTETTEHTKCDNALEWLHSMKIFYKCCMDLD